MEAVFHQLLKIAHHKMQRTREKLGLETGELVNEMVIKLFRQEPIKWRNREQFYRICSRWMSQVVIDQWRQANAAIHGGGQEHEPLSDSLHGVDQDLVALLALRQSLDRLAILDPQKSLIAELRFLWGMTIEEVATTLEIPPIRVNRDWKVARMWLADQLTAPPSRRDGRSAAA
jgi:RNA polymerase sigma factor (TIGR02999 family)